MDSEKYEELEVIGKGGQGTVYKVKKRSDRTIYALKRIDLPKVVGSEQEKKIESRKKILQNLSHTGIVKVFSIEQDKNTLDIEMEYIEGPTLQQAINKGFSDYKEGIDIMLKVLQPMIYIHAKNVAHLDIKPQNIILDGNNKPTIVDFGSSFLLDSSKELYTMTKNLEYTPGYVSPEIILKEENDKINPYSADIYSLGATLYTVLTQRRIYNASDPQSHAFALGRQEIIIPPHELNSNIDKNISQLCMQALAYNPKDRIQTVEKFHDDLEKFRNNLQVAVDNKSKDIPQTSIFKKILIRSSLISVIFGSYVLLANYMGRDLYTFQTYFDIAQTYEQRSNFDKAKEYYIEAANSGNTDAFIKIGDLYVEGGGGITKSYAGAKEWYEKAGKENTEAMFKIGNLYAEAGDKDDLKKDWEEAMKWYLKAEKKGNIKAMIKLGNIYHHGSQNTQQDHSKALEYYHKAYDLGKENIKNNIYKIYDELVSKTAPKEVSMLFQKLENKGYSTIFNYAGNLYKSGSHGFKQSYENSLVWYQKAAARGDIEAIKQIAHIYETGDDTVGKNYDQALQWYKKIEPLVLEKIAYIYEADDNTDGKNYEKAKEYYDKAVNKGSISAQYRLAKLFDKAGNEDGKNNKTIVDWYKKAAKSGHKESRGELGKIYESGKYGVEKNYVEALNCYEQIAGDDMDALNSAVSICDQLIKENKLKEEKEKYAKKIIELYEKALEKGNDKVRLELDLAAIYESGEYGIKQDYVKAKEHYEKIKEENHIAAFRVGDFYEQGKGVKKNYTQAKVHYKRALELFKKGSKDRDNNDRSKYEEYITDINEKIGNMYFGGHNTLEKNWKEALKYYEKTQKEKSYRGTRAKAFLNHVKIYYDGDNSVGKDHDKAYELAGEYLNKYKYTGHKDEKSMIKELRKIYNELSEKKN